ncbi:SPOR domain-containing protein [Sulfuriferula thiophila]|uniref:SPOR domain-containing protein n=1 Tax=Sulfuriferula thiophila TaxID=1781211 RepID=UPI000F614C3C|nr:SPOR domain-containing protein [Sulfuriferula thiophila]
MAIQATSEEQLRLKKRARQRLLGAATLLISAAIVLPMVLDQTPRPVNPDIAIEMPGAGVTAPPVSVVAPPLAVPAPTPAPQTSDVTAEKSLDPIKTAITQPAAEVAHNDVAEQKQSAEAKLTQQKEAEHKANEAKAAAAEKAKQTEQAKLAHDKEVAHQAALAAEKSQQAAKAKQSAPAKSDVAATKTELSPAPATDKHAHEADNGHYVVQLGAFSSAENVRQLRERLNAVGVSTYTETLPSGATRVRAGPFAERGQADKTLAKISAAGIQAQIVPLHK